MHRRELNQLLGTYALDSGDEAQAAEMFRSLLEEPGDIFSRSHFVPGHVTASAVVLSESGDQIALIDHPKLKKWLQPGGHVEAVDQSLIAAAHREVIEECGPLELQFDGLIDLDVHRIGRYDQEPTHQHFDAAFSVGSRVDLSPIQAKSGLSGGGDSTILLGRSTVP